MKELTELAELSENELRVLDHMDSEMSYPFRYVASMALVPDSEVRSIMRSFRTRGIACYGTLMDEDDGTVRGSGYWLSDAGYRLRNSLRSRANNRSESNG